MKPESSENPSEAFPKVGEAMVANMLQIRLMPLAYGVDHGVTVDMRDRSNPARQDAAQEWAAKYAQAFREYVEDNPREQINIHDDEALLDFFNRMREYATVH